MNYMSTVFMLLWSSGLQAEEKSISLEPDNIRLMGGASHCSGGLEVKLHNYWKPVDGFSFGWNLRAAAVVCRYLDCGSVVSTEVSHSAGQVWKINTTITQSGPVLRLLAQPQYSTSRLDITCSESVRLVNGTSLCSGTLEVKANQSWSSVCEGDLDWQDAEVVCRELGCGAPLKLKALNESIKAPQWTKESVCKGNESTLLDCGSHDSARNTCSPIGLTCSEPDNVRLVKGGSRCAGALEMKLQDDWKPVDSLTWDLTSAGLVCRQLKCGYAVITEIKRSTVRPVWGITSSRVQSGFALREHASTRPWHSLSKVWIACSDLLFQPVISVSPSAGGVYTYSDFTVSCYIKPQYRGGSFQLTFTTSNTSHKYIKPAVNHTAHFLFPAADYGHQGNYSCVYHIYVFSHNFSSESQPLSLSVSASPKVFIIRLVVLLLTLASFLSAICSLRKDTRQQTSGSQEIIKLDYLGSGASRAEDGQNEEAGAQGTDL